MIKHKCIRNSVALNCTTLFATVRYCAQPFSNCTQMRGITRRLQGLQLRASKIHLRWKPYLQGTLNARKRTKQILFHPLWALL